MQCVRASALGVGTKSSSKDLAAGTQCCHGDCIHCSRTHRCAPSPTTTTTTSTPVFNFADLDWVLISEFRKKQQQIYIKKNQQTHFLCPVHFFGGHRQLKADMVCLSMLTRRKSIIDKWIRPNDKKVWRSQQRWKKAVVGGNKLTLRTANAPHTSWFWSQSCTERKQHAS